MSTQGDLFAPSKPSSFDPQTAAIRKADGIARAEQNRDPEWKAHFRRAVEHLAKVMDDFTVADVRDRLDDVGVYTHAHDMLCAGALMDRAAEDGVIHRTGRERGNNRNHRKNQVYGSTARRNARFLRRREHLREGLT